MLVVAAAETEVRVAAVLPARNTAFDWVLTLEDGSARTGNVDFDKLALLDEREVAGRRMERRVLPLPGQHAEGYHTLALVDAAQSCRLILTPGKCWLPANPVDGHRLWGLAAQLYLLKSHSNWGIGDFRRSPQARRVEWRTWRRHRRSEPSSRYVPGQASRR